MSLWIKLVPRGVANRFHLKGEEIIEIHQNLPKYPALYRAILSHELGHESGGLKWKDLKHDLLKRGKSPGIWRFLRENPSAWWQLSPLWLRNGQAYWDISCLITWIIGLTISGGATWLLLRGL